MNAGMHGHGRTRSLREDVAGGSGPAELLEIEKILRARPISTYSTPPSPSAASSSSGAKIRLAAQVRLQLRGDTAQSHGLFQTLGRRRLEVAPKVLGSCRLVATDARLDRMIVRHRE
jgi:hypothetical protein